MKTPVYHHAKQIELPCLNSLAQLNLYSDIESDSDDNWWYDDTSSSYNSDSSCEISDDEYDRSIEKNKR